MSKDDNTLIKHEVSTIISIGGVTLSTFGNTLLAGWFLGKSALTVMGLLSSFTFAYAMFGSWINIGAATRASVALGKENRREAGKYETTALILSIVLSVGFSIILGLNLKLLTHIWKMEGQMYAMSMAYGSVMLLGGIFTTLVYFSFNFLRIKGKIKTATLTFGLMGVLDIILVFAFLKLGMGIIGVAWGSTISVIVANAMGIFVLITNKQAFNLTSVSFKEFIKLAGGSLYVGASPGINNLSKVLRTLWLNDIVLKFYGADGVSVLTIGNSIINFASAMVTGFGMSLYPIVAQAYGKKDIKGQMRLINESVRHGTITLLATASIIIIGALQISRSFGLKDPQLVGDAVIMVRLVAISLLPATIVNIFIYFYMAIGETVLSVSYTVLHTFVLIACFTSLCIRVFHGTYYAVAFTLVELTDFLIIWIVSRVRRKRNPKLITMMLIRNDD
ncbi:MATE family efflux transporter [Pseudobutyrivibrio sp. MD2005]|uniref:MATE family efflux transporter n=1 Tax=Pseudobutyrivibrio sp. MD2005 TaxID=1410616 RepID=UPI000482E237|nr:MATE family efflux transporter [Pseudobutyrivibrio sp. MD2005]